MLQPVLLDEYETVSQPRLVNPALVAGPMLAAGLLRIQGKHLQCARDAPADPCIYVFCSAQGHAWIWHRQVPALQGAIS